MKPDSFARRGTSSQKRSLYSSQYKLKPTLLSVKRTTHYMICSQGIWLGIHLWLPTVIWWAVIKRYPNVSISHWQRYSSHHHCCYLKPPCKRYFAPKTLTHWSSRPNTTTTTMMMRWLTSMEVRFSWRTSDQVTTAARMMSGTVLKSQRSKRYKCPNANPNSQSTTNHSFQCR